jgi:hypothetical protein
MIQNSDEKWTYQPAFAKFMAVPHYAYLALKIPGPRSSQYREALKYQIPATKNSTGLRKPSA